MKTNNKSLYQGILASVTHLNGAIYKDEVSNTLHALAVKNGAVETAHGAGDFCFKSITELKNFVEEYEWEIAKWIPVESAKDVPFGSWLVTLVDGSQDVCVVRQNKPIPIVGNCYHFDVPRVIAYKPLAEPYKQN